LEDSFCKLQMVNLEDSFCNFFKITKTLNQITTTTTNKTKSEKPDQEFFSEYLTNQWLMLPSTLYFNLFIKPWTISNLPYLFHNSPLSLKSPPPLIPPTHTTNSDEWSQIPTTTSKWETEQVTKLVAIPFIWEQIPGRAKD